MLTPSITADLLEETYPLISLALTLVLIVLNLIITLGLIKIAIMFADGQKPKYGDLFSQYRLIFKYLAGAILYGLIVFVGLLLLIVPGVIWSVKYQFFIYLMVDKGMGPVEALRKSGELTRGVKWNLFVFSFLLNFINILGALFFAVGLLVTVPLSMIAMAYVYRTLADQTKFKKASHKKASHKKASHKKASHKKASHKKAS